MMPKVHFLSLVVFLVVGAVGCATMHRKDSYQGTATIKVSGVPGSSITGFYVRDGQRHEIANILPFTLTETGVSEVEIRKVNLGESITGEARFDDPTRHLAVANMVAPPGVRGVRVQIRDGFSVEQLKR